MIKNDEKWFNEHLKIELNRLFSGKSCLSNFKCFLYPNSHWLKLPANQVAYEIKALLAEQNTYETSIPDDEMIQLLRKEISNLDLDL